MGTSLQSNFASRGPGTAGTMRRRTSPLPNAEINVTPLVDVMLVLLVIFMVTSPMMVTGVVTDLPEATTAPIGNDEPVSVELDHKGTVFLQGEAVALPQLGAKLGAVLKANKDARIFVRGSGRVDYGHVMEVIAQIHQAGYTKVALVTETPRDAPPPIGAPPSPSAPQPNSGQPSKP